MAPLPALVPSDYENLSEISGVALYDRHKGTFKPGVDLDRSRVHNSFEECRAAMVTARVEELETARRWCHTIACEVEHIRTIPAVPFPEVVMEPTPEAPAPEPPAPPAVEQPKAELKRPSRKAQ